MQQAETVILLRSKSPPIVEVIGHSAGGVVLQVSKSASIVRVNDRVIDEVPRVQAQAYDGPNLGCDRSGFPVVMVDAELEVGSIEERVVVSVWTRK